MDKAQGFKIKDGRPDDLNNERLRVASNAEPKTTDYSLLPIAVNINNDTSTIKPMLKPTPIFKTLDTNAINNGKKQDYQQL